MKIKFYRNDKTIIAGMTMVDEEEAERGNMALHTCLCKEDVIKNRQKLAGILGIGPDSFVCPNQTHSANFYQVLYADRGRGAEDLESSILDSDALFTYEPDLLLCCFTADCVPLIFLNESEGLIGVIHSGWQGSVKEIALKVFNHIIGEKGTDPKGIKVYIGGAISQEKFQVDEDVYLKFKKNNYAKPYIYYNEQTSKYHIDNKKVVKKQCEIAGIPAENISIDPTCTYVDPSCFSYRCDKQCGRHMSFIMRKTGRKENPSLSALEGSGGK